MALKTDAEMLQLIQDAIVAVLLGQSYNVNGQSVTRADLESLEKMETRYTQRIARDSNDNPQNLGDFSNADI